MNIPGSFLFFFFFAKCNSVAIQNALFTQFQKKVIEDLGKVENAGNQHFP